MRAGGFWGYILIALLILAAGLRMWGIGFGLPYFEHPDEWAVADEALRMLRTGNFSPFSYTYPTLYIHAQVLVAALHYAWGAALGQYANVGAIDPARFYVWARMLTALLGTGCVALTALIGRRLYCWPVGLIAAALLAVMPAASADAHYVTVDTPAAFMTLLAFWAIVRMVMSPQPLPHAAVQGSGPVSEGRGVSRVFLPGVLVGLAASTKYTCGILIIALLLACLMLCWDRAARPIARLRLAVPLMLCAGLAALLGFTLGTPMWVAEPQRLLADLESIARHYRMGHPGAESDRPALFYWAALHEQAALVAWLALAGLALAIIRHRRADMLVLAVVLPFIAQLSSVRVVFVRNAIPLLPFVLLLVAACVVTLIMLLLRTAVGGWWKALSASSFWLSALGFGLTLMLAIQPLRSALHDEWLRAQATTRILATEWLLQHAPDGTRIWLEDQTLILPSRVRVQGGQPISSHSPEWYRSNGFRFLVANASIAKSDPAALAAFGPAAAHFESAGQRYGHRFVIYDMGQADAAEQPRSPSGASLAGAALTLEGYLHAAQVRPGETLALALFWQVNRPLAANYTVFVHLIDAQGNKLAQRDMPPLDGSRPTSSWQAGEHIRDDQDLPIPADSPPGRYRLVVGLYDAQTMVSINDQGPIDIGEVEIK